MVFNGIYINSQAQAMYGYKATSEIELDLRPGDIVTLFSTEGEWWEGELNGTRGYVPAGLMALL